MGWQTSKEMASKKSVVASPPVPVAAPSPLQKKIAQWILMAVRGTTATGPQPGRSGKTILALEADLRARPKEAQPPSHVSH